MNDLFTFLPSSIQVIHFDLYTRLSYQVYCGRYNSYYRLSESPLANPFILDHERNRSKICDRYGEYIVNQIENKNIKILDEFSRLYSLYNKHGKLELVCWCKPKRCHCDTIKLIMDTSTNISYLP